ncbi:hypothetical protein PHMEG_0002932 [Phytophthora megakarya]|uniref:Reverse transcriptase RNase H-like domain-containing protein n=1 Tax=Phytophthora megakarya TaxID=4795 RepID=A0A225WX94_9STRA|nr:hypothetical protein PHMEG_0002932 [Phytophthora megakarya]
MVDCVEGYTGAAAQVLGVRRFRFQTQYDQEMEVDALAVEGAAGEFLLGEDWTLQNGVKIDFTSCEMKWYDGDHKKLLPFRCTQGGQKESGGAVRVRMVRTAKITTSTCRKVELGVTALEGAKGLFMPSPCVEPHLLLAPKLTTMRGGKVVVPVMNLPNLLECTDGCPPVTTLGVEHEIHTGTTAPTKVRPRRHAYEEHQIIDDNVYSMLKDSVVEKRSGAWGFPVVLVRKKDGAVSLDMHSGYWQVQVAAKDRDKTAFVTRKGRFRFTCLVYVNDVIVFTKVSMTQHGVELATVLERLSKAGLSLKAKKYTFAVRRLEYLDHELYEEGRTQGRPLLAYPDFSKPFRLVTDASKTGLGATVTQHQSQEGQHIAYASKVNSDTVANYSITDLKCAAVICAVKLFWPYLYERQFELVTDDAALTRLMSSKGLTGRLHRWALQLQETTLP